MNRFGPIRTYLGPNLGLGLSSSMLGLCNARAKVCKIRVGVEEC